MNLEVLNNNMKKQYTAFLIGFLAIIGVTFFAAQAYAQSTLTPTEVKLINPIGGTAENPQGTVSIPVILGGVIQTALTLMGSAALLMFVIGGVLWLTSAGNAERVKQGTQTMVWAAIGVLIIFSSYAILSLVLDGLGANDGPSPVNNLELPTNTNLCVCHEQDKGTGKITDAVSVNSESKADCEAYPSVTGLFDACGWVQVTTDSCYCAKLSADKTKLESMQKVEDPTKASECNAYPSKTSLFDQCIWVSE